MSDPARSVGLVKRAAAEFLVIFAGVSLGLLADDWRQDRLETVAAQEALVQLQDDLLRAELAQSRKVLMRQSAASAWFQRMWSDNAVDADSAGYAFRAYLHLPAFTFPRSAFESLRAGNRLSLVRPDSVRAAVIEYYDHQSFLELGYVELVNEKERTVDVLSPYFLRPPSRTERAA